MHVFPSFPRHTEFPACLFAPAGTRSNDLTLLGFATKKTTEKQKQKEKSRRTRETSERRRESGVGGHAFACFGGGVTLQHPCESVAAALPATPPRRSARKSRKSVAQRRGRASRATEVPVFCWELRTAGDTAVKFAVENAARNDSMGSKRPRETNT